jgi:hypothetical protein
MNREGNDFQIIAVATGFGQVTGKGGVWQYHNCHCAEQTN